MLCALLVHPNESEVFVLGTEPIQQQDGCEKNDYERNASKQLLVGYQLIISLKDCF